MKYFRVWKQLANLAISSYFSNRIDTLSYFLGKIVRFAFFLVFIFAIFNYTDKFAGYNETAIIIFFLTFNFLDTLGQAFFRGIYVNDIRTGNFDFLISKPINSLFYCLSKMTDILDIILLFPLAGLILFFFLKASVIFALSAVLLYIFYVILGLLIIVSFHILSASATILFIESENFIWFYRDLLSIGRFPPEVFSAIIQAVFTFVIPIFIIVAFPSKALLGLFTFKTAILALVYAFGFFVFSLWAWSRALRHYSSASS